MYMCMFSYIYIYIYGIMLTSYVVYYAYVPYILGQRGIMFVYILVGSGWFLLLFLSPSLRSDNSFTVDYLRVLCWWFIWCECPRYSTNAKSYSWERVYT